MPPLLFHQLATKESSFKTNNAARLSPINYSLGNTTFQVQLYKSPNTFFFTDDPGNKKRVILHFTAGILAGDISTLTPAETDPVRRFVSVPFVVARDGTIYQLFPSKNWAYSLGMRSSDGNNTDHVFDKRAVAIEISNIGPLVQDGDILKTPKDKNGNQITYCNIIDTDAYVKLDSPFREFQFFAKYTSVQMDSLATLVRWLCQKYAIPATIISPASRFSTNASTQNHAGIVSHVNYRKSGKWDIGTAFEWDLFQQLISVPVPMASTGTRGGNRGGSNVTKTKDEEKSLKINKGERYSKGREEVVEE